MEDTILEHELVANQRFAYHDKFGGVVISRPTPAVERKIAEERRRVYHRDLKDDSILTSDEVSEILKRRGVWTQAKTDRMQSLSVDSAQLMSRLTALGYESPSKMIVGLLSTKGKLLMAFADADQEILDTLERIFNTDIPMDPADLALVGRAQPTEDVYNLIGLAEGYLIQHQLLKEFQEVKVELGDLVETHAKFFGDTIESRGSQTERMARIYYCMRNAENGNALWPQFEDMWEEERDIIEWCSAQLYYFEYGVTPEQAKALQIHGFMARGIDIDDSSESSQDLPQSNSDGELLESKSESS